MDRPSETEDTDGNGSPPSEPDRSSRSTSGTDEHRGDESGGDDEPINGRQTERGDEGPVEPRNDQSAEPRDDRPVERRDEMSTTDTGSDSPLDRFLYARDGPWMWTREVLASAALVLVIGLVLFALSGVWPPMVAIESGSMEPNMDVGDLVFVTEPGRFAPDAATNDVGVITYEEGQTADYRTFGAYGSVIIFMPPDRVGSPIIHRAMFHVEEGEDWFDRADPDYVGGESCDAIANCPAPHDGFITKGDDNPRYDQVNGQSAPIREEWVRSVARVRVPYLGYVRLLATGQVELRDLLTTTGSVYSIENGGLATEFHFEPAHAEQMTVSSGDGTVSSGDGSDRDVPDAIDTVEVVS